MRNYRLARDYETTCITCASCIRIQGCTATGECMKILTGLLIHLNMRCDDHEPRKPIPQNV